MCEKNSRQQQKTQNNNSSETQAKATIMKRLKRNKS